MKLQISSIRDAGNLEKERLVLTVIQDTDIGQYAVFGSVSDEGTVTTDVKNVFWFPDQRIAAGDAVILYSKKGEDKVATNKSGRKSHFFYWDLEKPIWNLPDFWTVLLHIDSWISRNTDEDAES